MKEIRTEIIINAAREQVWNTLTDFSRYGEWNPFIIQIEGEAALHSKLRTTMRMKGKERHFTPQILSFEANHRFEWLGKMPLGLFTGQHYFELEDVGNGQTKLIHGEMFGGLLRGMIMKQIGEETRECFVAMNRALKGEVEGKSK